MNKIAYLLIPFILFMNGCSLKKPYPAEIEFISMVKNDEGYDIVFLSDTDFTILDPTVSASRVFCTASKEIYDEDFEREFSKSNTLGGTINPDIKPSTDEESHKLIYKVNLDYADIKTPEEEDNEFYCRITAAKYMGSYKETEVFKIHLTENNNG